MLTDMATCILRYDGFSLLKANDEGEVELDAIRDMLTRVGVAPLDDSLLEELEAWMAEADRDGSNALSFFEYVRVEARVEARLSAASAGLVQEDAAAT